MKTARVSKQVSRVRRLPPTLQTPEEPIRALGVSLVAIAAIVASMTVVRQRQEERRPSDPVKPDASPAAVDLDGIRAAGF